jgi:hypothetical protein
LTIINRQSTIRFLPGGEPYCQIAMFTPIPSVLVQINHSFINIRLWCRSPTMLKFRGKPCHSLSSMDGLSFFLNNEFTAAILASLVHFDDRKLEYYLFPKGCPVKAKA